MKRLIAILLACLLLCGCSTAPVAETTEPSETTTLPAVDPTEPGGSYDPDSAVEAQTNGAVRAYPLSIDNAYGVACMGDDVLVFSGLETTTLTKLSGQNLYVTATAQVGFLLYPDDASVSVTEKGIAYYSAETHELVTLDANLKEISRVSVPEDIMGTPVLSSDRKFLYYCTGSGVRELTLETGISRLLKEFTYPLQYVETLLLDGSVLCVNLGDWEGNFSTQYLSTENGQTLWEGESDFYLTGSGDTWYAVLSEGIMTGFVYGDASGDAQMIVPADFTAGGQFLEEMNCLIAESYLEGYSGMELDCYDLDSGMRISSLTLEDCGYPWSIRANGATGEIYVLTDILSTGQRILYRWDTAALSTGDETVYSGGYYTLDDPDEVGLAWLETQAQEIGDRYGVQILLGEEAVAKEPWDYDMTAEYQVPVLRWALGELETLLEAFPEGMLTDAVANTPDGVLRICIVRYLQGSAESGSLDTADGIQFWYDDNQYIALAVGENMGRTLYHELYHVLESRLLSDSSACYDWEYLNPDGFDYDYDYVANQYREDYQYLEDEDRYFIDMYSMSFPKEDRARILEYAMTGGNERFFQSEHMQAKLLALCKGLREAYGLEKSPDTFLWEQYLTDSLAYTK